MTPEREAELRAWCKEWGGKHPTYAHDLLAALDAERLKTASLDFALTAAIADTDDAEARLERERERCAKLERVLRAVKLLQAGPAGVARGTKWKRLNEAVADVEGGT